MRRFSLALLTAMATLGPLAARGEIFVLVGGGRVEGDWLNAKEVPRTQYVIKTRAGGTVTLARRQVDRVIHQNALQLEYEQVRSRYPDTAEGQWALAEWCREHHLPAARKHHMERVLELDPENVAARRGLGYLKVKGVWMTREDRMTKRGFIRYKGRWRLPLDVEILERRRKEELAVKGWIGKLKRLREALDSETASEAADTIRAIRDPFAQQAIRRQLEREPDQRVQRLYLETLANIATPAALKTLVDVSLHGTSEEIRLTAVELLAKQKEPEVTQMYIAALRDKQNEVVNRAAIGLASLEDPASLRPLIDALETKHKYRYVEGQPGMINSTFGKSSSSAGGFSGGGGGGLSVGGGPKIVTRRMKNPAVLDALVNLTGVNFDYDVKRWKYWLASQKRPGSVDARRD